jgi:tetratricopeptide (TPR) repeat protein
VLARALLGLHLLRCPACRAEASQVRALDAALTALPRFDPSPELLPRVLARAENCKLSAPPRKETKPMRRLAYALAFLIVIGLVAGGLLVKPDRPDGRSLLISAAEAMGLADTVHARVYGSIAGYYPAMRINNDYDEYWFAPEGFRRDSYHEDGTLWRSLVASVAQGRVWMQLPTRATRPGAVHQTGAGGAFGGGMAPGDLPTTGVSIEYYLEPSDLAAFAEQSQKRFVNADLRVDEIEQSGHTWTSSVQQRDGRDVILIEEDLGLDLVQGDPRGAAFYYIDPSAGQLIALEVYGPEEDGFPLLAQIEDIEYGLDVPPSTFTPALEMPEETIEGTCEVREGGYVVFDGMGHAPTYDPRANTLFDRAQEVRHWVTMGVLPWDDLENAYLAVLEEDPSHYMARTYLGRFYTRWGMHAEALALLPEGDKYWSDLNRAFCYDALGRREEAVAIYEGLAGAGHDSVAEWAKLGLEKPTWPSDLPILPEAGEITLRANAGWHASASNSAFHAEPAFAIDADPATQWTNGGGQTAEQEPGQWFELGFDSPVRVTRVALDHYGEINMYVNNWPRGVDAFITEDGRHWSPVSASPGGPRSPVTVKLDQPRALRGIRFVITKPHAPEWWGIYEVFVFGPAG